MSRSRKLCRGGASRPSVHITYFSRTSDAYVASLHCPGLVSGLMCSVTMAAIVRDSPVRSPRERSDAADDAVWKPTHSSHPTPLAASCHEGAVAVVSTACLALSLSGCGNWIEGFTEAGRLGITVDGAGQPVIAIMTCSKVRPVISMYEGRKRSEPKAQRTCHAAAGRREKPSRASRSSRSWRRASTGNRRAVLGRSRQTGSSSWRALSVDDELASVGVSSFRTRDLAALTTDEVRVHGKIMSWSTSGAYQCG